MKKHNTLLCSIAGLGILAGATLLAHPAGAQPLPPAMTRPVCLETSRIYDFNPLPDNRSIIVTDRLRKTYKVSLQFPCLELKWRTSLGFQSLAGSGLACLQRGDRVIARGHGFPSDRCLIDRIEAYTPEMGKADKAAAIMDRPH